MKRYRHEVDSEMLLDWINEYVNQLSEVVDDLEKGVYDSTPHGDISVADLIDNEVVGSLNVLNALRELLLDEGESILH